jgi:hypothetical protein
MRIVVLVLLGQVYLSDASQPQKYRVFAGNLAGAASAKERAILRQFNMVPPSGHPGRPLTLPEAR